MTFETRGLACIVLQPIHSYMAYSRRLTRRRQSFGAELMYLLVVLAAGVMTAYWAGDTLQVSDGWHDWALTRTGMVTWEGTAADPPAPTN